MPFLLPEVINRAERLNGTIIAIVEDVQGISGHAITFAADGDLILDSMPYINVFEELYPGITI